MNEIMKTRIFIDTGSYQREKEDLSYYVFKNLDFIESKRHISFFRSDFRGSTFSNVKFYRNNFDRADLISCNICDCSFDSVNFGGCEIKNCYFEDTIFESNKYNGDGTEFQQSTFVNCHFRNEHFLLTMYDCKFINCNFSDCVFEQSSTERLEFLNCKILNTDFATMHAEQHRFISCELKNICLDISYIFGYLFYDTNINAVDFLYRGEIIQFDALDELYKELWIESRYFEFMNANVLLKKLDGISDIIIKSMECLYSVEIIQFRQMELNNILEAICFYIRFSMLPFVELIKILEYFDQFEWQQFTFEETLNYLSKFERIKRIMSSGEYQLNHEFIDTIPYNDIALIEVRCDTNNFNEALATSEELIKALLKRIHMPEIYRLINQKQGSWELVFLVPALCAIILPVVFRNTVSVITDFSFKMKFEKSLLSKLSENPTIDELESIAKAAALAKIISVETNDLSSIASSITSDIIKSIKIGI